MWKKVKFYKFNLKSTSSMPVIKKLTSNYISASGNHASSNWLINQLFLNFKIIHIFIICFSCYRLNNETHFMCSFKNAWLFQFHVCFAAAFMCRLRVNSNTATCPLLSATSVLWRPLVIKRSRGLHAIMQNSYDWRSQSLYNLYLTGMTWLCSVVLFLRDAAKN